MANTSNFGDLSKRKNSITAIINENNEQIMAAQTVSGMVLVLTKLFAEHNVDTPASNRLINKVSESHNLTEAQFNVYNSFLAGTGNAVI
jgi:hypothetical protein